MTSRLEVVEWFKDGPLPSVTPDPAMVLGGTAVLRAFTDAICRFGEGGQLWIASAFTDANVTEELPALADLPHQRVDLAVLTSSENDAETVVTALETYAWRSFSVRVLRGLHAKMYSFVGDRAASACLIGSHNFTAAGARRNSEAGVLFVSTRPSFVRTVAIACADHMSELARDAKRHHDTLKFTKGLGS
jgi:phosphatidylserine/phosphatidylglycerophosphate/cardiolipin synthase-like enzyme